VFEKFSEMFVFGMIGNTDVEILNPEEVIIKK
jgi:hypothetical protein